MSEPARTTARAPKRRTPRVARPSTKGLRSCLGCRGRFERAEMIRVVCDPDGQVLVDRYLKAPGRGAHLCHDRSCIEAAVKRRAFGRAFDRPVAQVEVEPLRAAVLAAIEARLEDALALARRAGFVRSGTDVLERDMARVSVLVMATDAAPASADRLARRAHALGVPVVVHADRGRLGHSQGQDARIAVGITDAGLARRVLEEVDRRHRVSVAA